MTDLNREIVHQKLADAVAAASIPANAALWLWLERIDLIFRVGVGVGSFILICFAIRVKLKQWWKT